jgi:Ca-activated chloride channel family protein
MNRQIPRGFSRVFVTAAVLGVLAGLPSLSADEIALSGVDARMSAVTGDVSLYAVVTDPSGRPVENLTADDFIVTDAPEGSNFGEKLDITRFSPAGERRDGLVFMLLIDDSGSMYDGPDGRPSPGPGQTRAALARREARNFIDGLGSSLDRAGLAEFGTRYRVLAGPRTDRASITERLGLSTPPVPEEAYTELYAAITRSADDMSSQKGRRIVILFSDGENYPYAERKGLPHPDYGDRVFTPDEALTALQGEGVTLYAVRFGPNRDADLARITLATGGVVFDVNGEEELSGLYASVRERVLAEYRLDYRAGLTGADRTVVKVELAGGGSSSKLVYPSGFLFGVPATSRQALFSLLALPFALAVVVVLALARSAKPVEVPSLQRLRPFGGSAVTVALDSGRTVISPGLAGEPTSIEPEGLKNRGPSANTSGTIVVEKGKDGRWRAAGGQGVIVNNRKSDMTVLENGDVIRSGDELIVFDDGES